MPIKFIERCFKGRFLKKDALRRLDDSMMGYSIFSGFNLTEIEYEWTSKSNVQGMHPRFKTLSGVGGHNEGWLEDDSLAEETWEFGIHKWLLYHHFGCDVEGSPKKIRPISLAGIGCSIMLLGKPQHEQKLILSKTKLIGEYFNDSTVFKRLGFIYQKCKQGQEIDNISVQCGAIGYQVKVAIDAWIFDSMVRTAEDNYLLFKPYTSLPIALKQAINPTIIFDKDLMGPAKDLTPKVKQLLDQFAQSLTQLSQGADEDKEYIQKLKTSYKTYFGYDVPDLVAPIPGPIQKK